MTPHIPPHERHHVPPHERHPRMPPHVEIMERLDRIEEVLRRLDEKF